VAVEKKLHNNNHSDLVIAAESANNAGAITALIPLLILAIPIIPSETLILSMAEQHGFGMGSSLKFLTSHLNLFTSVLIVVSFINVFLSGMMYTVYIRVFKYLNTQVYHLLFFALLGITLANAYAVNQMLLTVVILSISFGVGRLIKSSAVKSIVIMSFFLSDEIVNELYRFLIFKELI
jgi:putative tricarboxylic transport membrane protein